MANNCTPASDLRFGPIVASPCRDGQDFTLLFEQSILTLVPATVFLFCFPFRFVYLARKNDRAKSSLLRALTASVLAAVQLGLVVLWGVHQSTNAVSIASAVVNFIVAVQVVGLSWVEDARSVRPSTMLSLYLFVTILLDLPQARTLWMSRSYLSETILVTANPVIKGILLVLENVDKRSRLYPVGRHALPSEATSGIVNRSFLWWINKTIRSGFSKALSFNDMQVLDKRMSSTTLSEKVTRAWNERRLPERRLEFPLAVCRALAPDFIAIAFPRILAIGFTFTQPFLIQRILTLLSDSPERIEPAQGYGLIAATCLIYLGLAVLRLNYNQKVNRFTTMFRGAAVSLIYDKTLTTGDGHYDESAALTLMSADVDRIAASLTELNECWARAIEVAIGITLLARELGYICLMPVLLVVVSFLGAQAIANRIGGNQQTWVDAVQKRIALTSSVLLNIRSFKMMGLGPLLSKVLQDQRIEETKKMAKYRWNIVWQNTVQNLPWALAPALTFVVLAGQIGKSGTALPDATKVFTSLSIITLLTDPAAKLLSAIPATAASLGCVDRVQQFLIAPARVDSRQGQGRAQSTVSRDTSTFCTGHGPGERAESLALTTLNSQAPSPAIMMDNVFVRSPDAVTPVLQGVTFSVSPGTIAVITGPVGSGKSTLLRTILGETTVDLGSVMVSKSSVGFCSQSPWLPSTSIRNAICDPFDLEVDVDQDWYCKVIEACDLRLDLSRLTRGDETVIGTGGTLLSGGQKQRIALARALYTRSKILVLDDVLSALDNKTRLNVVENLLGESGLCRKLNMTVILASHAVEVHRFADKILGLADGRIEHEGSHSQLVRAGVLQKFEQTVASAVDSDAEDTAKAINIQNDSSKAAEANEKDDLKRRVGDRAVYSYYFKSIGWKKSMLFLGFASGHVFATTFSQIWLKWWVDGGNYKTSLFTSIYVLLAVVNAAGICGYASAMLITITPSVARKLHYVLLRTIMRAPRSFFDTASAGDILNRFSQDMSLIETQLATGALVTITNILGAAAEVALIATGSAYMAVTIPLLIITVYFLQNVYLRTSRQLRLLDLETRGPLFSLFVETLEGLSTIRAFDWQSSAVKRCRYLLDESQKPFYLLLCVQSWLNLVLDLIVAAESVIVVSLAITLRTHTNAAFLGVSLNNILVFNASLASVIQGWTLLETSLGSIARLRTLERNVQPEEQPSESTPPPMHWPSGGSITLSNLTASYNDTSPAIADINLEIQPGQKIGVCGRTGSGKSSLIAMMARLVEISAGSMTIDGMDASSIPRDKLREKLAFIPQDAPILVGSLRFNVDPANTKDDSDIIRALDRVGLWSSLADRGGLELQLTPTSLSHGQRQLLSLARAILKNTKILLLDEPTSHIDAEQEAKLQDVLREEFADCTTITVAHRMNTIYPASDMIVVMEEGRIVEAGRPENLLRLDGKFAQLLRVTEG